MDPGIKNQRWKIKALKEELLNNSLHTPFFVLTETHLKPYHVDAEVHIGGYTVIRADRIRGGVAIYLHNSISADTVKVFSNSYCESVINIYSFILERTMTALYEFIAADYWKL
jgi:hypothetical protein